MPLITIHHDPSGACKREKFEVKKGLKVSDFLREKWPNGLDLNTYVFLNGVKEKDLLFKLPDDAQKAPDYTIKENDIIHIVKTPESTAAWLIGGLILGVASSVLLVPNVPTPEVPNFEKAQESPNNNLTGQTNIARPLQRIPDIYGKNRIYPDLIAPSYFEYIDNIKYLSEFMCIGRGEFLVESFKSGDTLLNDIAGSSFTVHGPNTGPDTVLNVINSNEVDGQELAGPNDAAVFELSNVAVSFFNSVMEGSDSALNEFRQLNAGDTFTISNSSNNNGTFTFQSLTETTEDEGEGIIYSFYSVAVSETFTTESTNTVDIDSNASAKRSSYGPFIVGGGAVDSIWIDLQCPRGLQLIDGSHRNKVILDFKLTIQEIDSNGSSVGSPDVRTVDFDNNPFKIQGNTQDAQFRTFKFIPSTLTTGTAYEVTLERLTDTVNNASKQIYDLSKWTRLAGVKDITQANYGDVTTVFLRTKATEQATSVQERKFNAVVTRKLKTYNTSTKQITTTLSPTKKMADAVLNLLTDAGKPTAQIELDELYEIQNRLDNDSIYADKLGRFCWTFSDSKTPVLTELATILNAARCTFYQEGSLIRFVRDEIQNTPVALFNARVKSPESESKIYNFFRTGDIDGVELSWTDEITNETQTILLPSPNGGQNNKQISGVGIKNYYQAWNRASYEFERLKLQRENVSAKISYIGGAAILPRINDRVANVDGTNVSAQGGEIIDFINLTVETNQKIDFKGLTSGVVRLRSKNNTISAPLPCTPRTDGKNGFILISTPPFAIFTSSASDQVGMIYSFYAGNANATDKKDYLISKLEPDKKGFVKVTMVNYREQIYNADTQTPPTI